MTNLFDKFNKISNKNFINFSNVFFLNNIQSLIIDWNKNWNKYGFKIQHIAQNPIGGVDLFNKSGGKADWNDFTYGIIINQRYKNILFNTNIDWVHSNSYLWEENKKRENILFLLNREIETSKKPP